MSTWVAHESRGRRYTIQADTYGEAIETAFPAVCAQDPDWHCARFNHDPHGPLVIVDADTGRFEVWTVCLLIDEDPADRFRRLAAIAEGYADNLDECEDMDQWRASRWARKALDELAADWLAAAHRLDVLEDDLEEMRTR